MDSIVHFDVPVDDQERARTFYTNTFDWQCQDVPGSDYILAYTAPVDENQMPTQPGAINGGLTARSEETRIPMLYINVSSIEESLVKVEQNGGKILVPKTQMGEWGSYAQFLDSEGNAMGVWEM